MNNLAKDSTSKSVIPAQLSELGLTVFERGWLSSNNILAIGRDQATIVDTGYSTHARQTVDLVELALGPRKLTQILNTHLHSDHCGGNAALKEAFPEVRIHIPPGQADAVERWDPVELTYEPTGQACQRFSWDELIRPGTNVMLGDFEWQVHAAKGHDPHSVVLFEPNYRVLISADALWENGFGVVFPELEDHAAFQEVAVTLEMIQSLQPAWVIPGHGSVFSDVSHALQKAHSRLRQFSENPHKHRRHALKVLVKFKMLEWQTASWDDLSQWFAGSPYFENIIRKDSSADVSTVLLELVSELQSAGALVQQGTMISNR